MVLLDILRRKPGIQIVAAHLNHGIRHDALKDEALVKQTTQRYGIPFEVKSIQLGVKASEEKARKPATSI